MAFGQRPQHKTTSNAPGRADYEALESRVLLTTFTVTSAADLGAGTLRQAIIDANVNSDTDAIVFAIPGPGVHRIAVGPSPFPDISHGVTIDATTQPGFAGAPVIELVGTGAATNGAGLRIAEPSTVAAVRGLAIGGFATAIDSFGQNVTIAGNYIGLAADGTPLPNDVGLNVIGNGSRVGGSSAADMNVISSNRANGVVLGGYSAITIVQGNRIGTDPTGLIARPNGVGVYVKTRAVVGGNLPGQGNLISGNTVEGVRYDAGTSTGFAFIQGDLIGTDRTGTHALPNGVGIHTLSEGALIGGSATAYGNTISGNVAEGVLADGRYTTVQGNRIGLAADGVTPLGNGGAGVALRSRGSSVGGTSVATSNLVAYNGGAGVAITGTSTTGYYGCFVRLNAIRDNAGLGIDLGADGPTANDPGDTDPGPNDLQNYPVLNDAATANGRTYVGGTLDSTPNVMFVIDLYANRTGQAQGELYLGSVNVLTDGAGVAAFGVWLDAAPTMPGQTLTATAGSFATGVSNTVFYETSEFSDPLTIAAAADANRDGRVDFTDLAALAQHYNQAWSSAAGGDFNRDGQVDFFDLALLAQAYNTGAAEPASIAAVTPSPARVEQRGESRPVFSLTPLRKPAPPPKPKARLTKH